MRCDEFRDQITDYVDGALDDDARAGLETHLSACAECREDVEAVRRLWNRLGEIPGGTPDSAAMRLRFEEAMSAYRGGLQDGAEPGGWVADAGRLIAATNRWMSAWWPRQPVVQFGMALALFVVGVVAAPLMRSGPEPPPDEVGILRDELHQTQQLVALSLLQQQSASERLRGVSWSNQIDSPSDEVLSALLNTLMRDPNVNVRLAAVDALRKFAQSQSVRQGALRALDQENSPLVQSELIAFVVDFEESGARDILRRYAEDPTINEGVRARAALGLERFQ